MASIRDCFQNHSCFERHCLTYNYFYKADGDIFTAMGLLDSRMIDYYDSSTQLKEPRKPWNERLKSADYCSEGSESRKNIHEWLKFNMDRIKWTQHNNTAPQILQRRRGCEGELQPDKKMKLIKGMDMYGLDGEDFLSFDDSTGGWVAHSSIAEQTKEKWDEDISLKEETKGYLEKECLCFLEKFVKSAQEDNKAAAVHEVFTFRRKASVETNNILGCMATGFISQDTEVHIKRDGRTLTERDGLSRGGVLPNGDGTFQNTLQVETLKSDKSNYTCEVFDPATKHFGKKVWEDEPAAGSQIGIVIGGVVGGLVVLGALVGGIVLLVKWLRKSAGSQRELVRQPSPSGSVISATGDLSTTVTLIKSSHDSIPSQDSGVSSTTETPEHQGLMEDDQQ